MKKFYPHKLKIFLISTLFSTLFGGIEATKNYFFQRNSIKWMALILIFLHSFSSHSQAVPNPIFFTWESYVGCIEGEQKRSYEESIAAGICHVVCQGSKVNYTLSGSGLTNTTWTVLGGTILSQTTSTCVVKWSSTISTGAIGVSTFAPTGFIEFIPICVEIKTGPTAFFGQDNHEIIDNPLIICRNTTVNFTNLSSANGGTPINASYWDFKDGITSTATNPSHTFEKPGEFHVNLKVTNQCYCSSEYEQVIIVTEEEVIPISCATVVCEGQIATYSIPKNYKCDNFDWSVVGGTVTSTQPYTDTIEVLWELQNENSDRDGFGYVTFNPRGCDVKCFKPSTVKIPIIRSNGTIVGKNMICGDTQELYSLPQWPTTDFQWTIVNENGANASLVLTGQRNEVMINSGNQAGSFTLSATYQNTLLKCGGTASIRVQVRVPAIIQGSRVVCLQETGTSEIYDLQGAYSATWKWKKLPSGPTTTIVGTFVNPQFSAAGEYSITASGSIFCKAETYLVKVVDPAPLTAGNLLTSTVICPQTPMTFQFTNTVPNSELYYSVTGGTITGSSSTNSVDVVFDYPITGAYSLKVKRLVGSCFSTELVIPLTLPVIPTTIKGATAGAPAVVQTCGSTMQTYTMPFAGADTYTWRIDPPAVGSLSSPNGTSSVNVLWNEYSTPTPATLYVDVKNCGITTTRFIVVNVGSPVITMTPITGTICSQNNQNFSIISTPPLTSGTVVWDFGDGGAGGTGISATHKYDLNNTSPTSYTVSATISNPNGCTTPLIVTQLVNVAIAPVALITPQGYRTACNFADFSYSEKQLTATIQSGYGASVGSPKWYKDGVLISGATSNIYSVSDFGTYTVEVTNGTCSSFSNEIVFEKNCAEPVLCVINPDPALTLNVIGDCGSFTAAASYAGSPSIVWKNYGKVTSNATSASYSFEKAGYYSIGYNATYIVDGAQCVVSKSVPITVPYVANIKHNITCPPDANGKYTVQLLDSSTYLPFIANLTYKFYVNNAEVLPTGGSPTQRTVNLNPNATYDLKVVIQNPGYAACSKTISLYLPAVPNANFTIGAGPYCQDAPISFTIPTQAGSTYEWSFTGNFSNKQQNPTLTFTSGGIKTISLKVTNSLGCSKTISKSITVTPTIYEGDIQPGISTACANGSVNLTFNPTLGSPVNFIWMKGNQPAPGPNTNPKAVSESGRYWVRVGSANGCYTDIYKPVAVTILPPVVPSISGRNTLCTGDYLTLTSNSGGTYKWTMQPPSGPSILVTTQQVMMQQLDDAGTYVFTLEVKIPTSGTAFCVGTSTHTVTVYDAPAPPQITTTLITCQPYKINLKATNVQPGTFMWSNGVSGSEIVVNEGGPYQVVFTNVSGCSATATETIPRSLESYMWIFPTGCLDYCSDKYDGRFLIGPSVMEFAEWDWSINSTVELAGIEEVAPFPVMDSGVYDLMLSNDFCHFKSGSLNVNNMECRECEGLINIDNVEIISWDTSPFLSYSLALQIDNTLPNPVLVTLTANNTTGIFNPSTIMLQPGAHIYLVQFIPLSSFNPGLIEVTIEFLNNGRSCAQLLYMDFPDTNTSRENNVEKDILSIAPNPATHSTAVHYKFVAFEESTQLALYDLMGRFLDVYDCNSISGTWQLNTSSLAPGQYLIVLKKKGQVMQQQHLIIKP